MFNYSFTKNNNHKEYSIIYIIIALSILIFILFINLLIIYFNKICSNKCIYKKKYFNKCIYKKKCFNKCNCKNKNKIYDIKINNV